MAVAGPDDRFGQAAPGAAGQLDGTHGSERRDADECDGMAQQHAAPDRDRQGSQPPARPFAFELRGQRERQQCHAGIRGVLLQVIAHEHGRDEEHPNPGQRAVTGAAGHRQPIRRANQ